MRQRYWRGVPAESIGYMRGATTGWAKAGLFAACRGRGRRVGADPKCLIESNRALMMATTWSGWSVSGRRS
jgi:hypothetical protein